MVVVVVVVGSTVVVVVVVEITSPQPTFAPSLLNAVLPAESKAVHSDCSVYRGTMSWFLNSVSAKSSDTHS